MIDTTPLSAMQNLSKLVEKATRQAFRIEGSTVTLTFGAQTVTVFQGDVSKTKDQEFGGFVQDYDSVFFAVKTDFTTVPAEGDQVTADGVTYRVVATTTSANDPAIRLAVKGINK